MSKWTEQQVAFLIVKKSEGYTMPDICKKFNRKFGMNRNVPQLYSKLHKLKTTYTQNIETKIETKRIGYMKYTQPKIDYVHAAFGNNFPKSILIKGFKEQFNENITERQISYIMKSKTPTNAIVAEEKIVDERIAANAKSVKAWHSDTASRKQCAKIMKMTYPQITGTDLNALISDMYEAKTMTKKEASDRIEELSGLATQVVVLAEKQKTAMLEEVVETLQEFNTDKLNRTRHRWTEEEEFDLICNFYELSIDEAKEKFQRPYYAIAKRLEMIVDSTEPEHIDMLMRASKVIKERKEMMHRRANSTWRSRRKLRKQAKKVAKLERKLKKMRGE